jgi:hypothetical protein
VAAKLGGCEACGWVLQILPENSRFPISSDQQKVAASNHHFRLSTAGLSLSSFFWLFTSGFPLKLSCALLETTNYFDS